ncbi:MAG: hypothetical protein IKR09_04015, partial [Alphaproteobacteria bacterium]|nr:hypothetical protein [Alphaproteobacteria bacterium]
MSAPRKVLKRAIFSTVSTAALMLPSTVFAAEYYGSGVEGYEQNVFEKMIITEDGSTITGTFSNLADELDNTATNGGGVFRNEAKELHVFDAIFDSNRNGGLAAAFFNRNGAEVIFNNVTFTNNFTPKAGGAFDNQMSIATFNGNALFKNNTSGTNGGAVYNITDGTLDVIMTFNGSTTFINNTARIGGALCISTTAHDTIDTITFNGDTLFEGNTAQYGGAFTTQLSTAIFNGTTVFKNNTATVQGGAIRTYKGSILTFNGNALFQGNTANGTPNSVYLFGNSTDRTFLNIQPAAGKTFTDYDGMQFTSDATINIGGAGTINLLGGIVNIDGTAAGKNTVFQTINNGEKAFSGHLVIGRKNVAVTNVNLSGGTLVFDLNGYTPALAATGLLNATRTFALSSDLKIKAPSPLSTATPAYDFVAAPVAEATYTLASGADLSALAASHSAGDFEDASKSYAVTNANNKLTATLGVSSYLIDGANSEQTAIVETFRTNTGKDALSVADNMTITLKDIDVLNKSISLSGGAILNLRGRNFLRGGVTGSGRIVATGDLTVGKTLSANSISVSNGTLTLLLDKAATSSPMLNAGTVSITNTAVSYASAAGYAPEKTTYHIVSGDLSRITGVTNGEIVTLDKKQYTVNFDKKSWNLAYYGTEIEQTDIGQTSNLVRTVSVGETRKIGRRLTSFTSRDFSKPRTTGKKKGRSGGGKLRTSNVWGEASYGHMHMDGTTSTDSAGFTLGIDGEISQAARLGFAAGYSGTRSNGMQAGTYSGFLYGMYVYKSWAFTGSAGYLFTKFD